jgi:hypothetical protein
MIIRYTQDQKIGKQNNLKVFWSKKTNEHKQDDQNPLRSPVTKQREINNVYEADAES